MGTAERINASQRTLPYVEIMDSTLRDGEQTNGVSFLPHEKLMMARMLLGEVNVDRIEVASARVSEGEKEAVGMICRYAEQIGKLDRVEVLGFVDGKVSVDWIADCGGKTINLLAKALSNTAPISCIRLRRSILPISARRWTMPCKSISLSIFIWRTGAMV